jgi:DNA-binding transcriptional LysR family regulator
MLNVPRLQVLCEIARHGSLAGAAAALAYTPSAVSQQVASLEREAGTTLVERLPRGARLTEAGRVLVDHAERVLAELRAAEASLASIAAGGGGRLRVGAFTTANAILVPLAVAALRARHPAVTLGLLEADLDEAFALLAARELDLAVVYEVPVVKVQPPDDVELVWLLDDPLHVAMAPSHPLAGRRRLRLADLAEHDWVQGVHRGSTIDVLPRACRSAGFEPRIAFRTDDQMTVQGLVAAGVGVSLAPTLILPSMRPDLVVRPIDEPALTRRVLAAVPRGMYRLPAAAAMLQLLAEAAGRLGG